MSDPAPPHGQYQAPGGAQPGYAPAPGYQGTPVQAAGGLASYGSRVAAILIDGVITSIPVSIGYIMMIAAVAAAANDSGSPSAGVMFLSGLLILVGVLFATWNQGIRQGSTGQSIGKRIMKIKLVRIADGMAPGVGIGLGRYFIRAILASVTFGIYSALTLLWPLWDERRQTLDDKIVSTLVVQAG